MVAILSLSVSFVASALLRFTISLKSMSAAGDRARVCYVVFVYVIELSGYTMIPTDFLGPLIG